MRARVCGRDLGSDGAYNPAADPYSIDSLTMVSRRTKLVGLRYTGKGIDIALIDTGVSPVAG